MERDKYSTALNIQKPSLNSYFGNEKYEREILFRGHALERESKGEAEFVEDGSVVMRSEAVQHSRMHPTFGFGDGPKETVYLSDLRMSETFGLPKRLSKNKQPPQEGNAKLLGAS